MTATNNTPAPTTALTVASVVAEGGAMTVAQMRANRALIKELMKSEMEEGLHYGVIKGTEKPTLFKPGAELLLALFRVDAVPAVEDLSTADCIRYRVTMKGVHMPTGISVGHGVGEASTDEEKYKWRGCWNDREWDATPEDRRRLKFGYNRDERREYETRQVRTNPADAANTILKMAAKRAKVDLALSVTAASDVFGQDLEDMAKWLRENETGTGEEPPAATRKTGSSAPRQRAPASSSTNSAGQPQSGKINANQLQVLKTEADRAGVSENALLEKFKVERLEDLPFAELNNALMFCKRIHDGGDQ